MKKEENTVTWQNIFADHSMKSLGGNSKKLSKRVLVVCHFVLLHFVVTLSLLLQGIKFYGGVDFAFALIEFSIYIQEMKMGSNYLYVIPM